MELVKKNNFSLKKAFVTAFSILGRNKIQLLLFSLSTLISISLLFVLISKVNTIVKVACFSFYIFQSLFIIFFPMMFILQKSFKKIVTLSNVGRYISAGTLNNLFIFLPANLIIAFFQLPIFKNIIYIKVMGWICVLIWLAWSTARTTFFRFFIFDKDFDARNSLKESWSLTKNNLKLYFYFGLQYVLGFISLVLLLLFIKPLAKMYLLRNLNVSFLINGWQEMLSITAFFLLIISLNLIYLFLLAVDYLIFKQLIKNK